MRLEDVEWMNLFQGFVFKFAMISNGFYKIKGDFLNSARKCSLVKKDSAPFC
jgi:hypothetical protein